MAWINQAKSCSTSLRWFRTTSSMTSVQTCLRSPLSVNRFGMCSDHKPFLCQWFRKGASWQTKGHHRSPLHSSFMSSCIYTLGDGPALSRDSSGLERLLPQPCWPSSRRAHRTEDAMGKPQQQATGRGSEEPCCLGQHIRLGWGSDYPSNSLQHDSAFEARDQVWQSWYFCSKHGTSGLRSCACCSSDNLCVCWQILSAKVCWLKIRR